MIETKNIEVKKVIDLDKVLITLLEEGVVHNYVKLGKVIEAEDVYEIRNINLELVNYHSYGVLVESDELTSFSKEARNIAASEEIDCRSAAKALLINSLGQRIIANFYLKLHKPFVNTKIFENRNEAIIWIKKEVDIDKVSRKIIASIPKSMAK